MRSTFSLLACGAVCTAFADTCSDADSATLLQMPRLAVHKQKVLAQAEVEQTQNKSTDVLATPMMQVPPGFRRVTGRGRRCEGGSATGVANQFACAELAGERGHAFFSYRKPGRGSRSGRCRTHATCESLVAARFWLIFEAEVPGGDGALEQYTPDLADWSVLQSEPMANGATAHDPDSIGWISSAQWANSQWDGSIYDPTAMSRSDFLQAICPNEKNTLRGIRELFYQHNPFADNVNPTKAEVDEWHRIVINHMRALVGYTGPDRQIEKDHCLFATALISSQRKHTDMWDEAYPGTCGSCAGPCLGCGNSHCGDCLIPSAEDQAPYLPPGHRACTSADVESYGRFGGLNSVHLRLPWSMRMSRFFCSSLDYEGFWGGHMGPVWRRSKFGLDFWTDDGTDVVMRAKWGGQSMDHLYTNPDR